MSDNYLKILIKIVNNNEDTSLLVKQGLTYSQISKLINDAILNGYLEETKEFELIVTEKGRAEVQAQINPQKLLNKKHWIESDEKSRVDRLGLFDVYLPTDEESKLLW